MHDYCSKGGKVLAALSEAEGVLEGVRVRCPFFGVKLNNILLYEQAAEGLSRVHLR